MLVLVLSDFVKPIRSRTESLADLDIASFSLSIFWTRFLAALVAPKCNSARASSLMALIFSVKPYSLILQ